MGLVVRITLNVETLTEPQPVKLFKGSAASLVFSLKNEAGSAFSLANVLTGGMRFQAKASLRDETAAIEKTGSPDSPASSGVWTVPITTADITESGVMVGEVSFLESGGRTVAGQVQIVIQETVG